MVDEKPNDSAARDRADGGRRRVLATCVAVGSVAYGALVGVPAARLASAGGPGGAGQRWLRVARLADLPPGKPTRVEVRGDARDAFTVTRAELLGSIWLVREGDGVRAMSATCPHLGCSVDLADAAAPASGFTCPCHTSRFALDGATVSGPSPRAMDALETRVVDGAVEVDFRRFRQGITGREESGA